MLNTVLGDYPVTRALKSGAVSSPGLEFSFADAPVPNKFFKRVVRALEFDVAELALMTFLLAKAQGKPLRLLPVVLTARFQHPLLVCSAARAPLAPKDLVGRRVGVRSYSVTTGVWLRGVLMDDYGVAPEQVRWVSFEEPHVAEYRDPPFVESAPAGADLIAMLHAGELDAAIIGEAQKHETLRPVIPDPEAAAEAWRARTGAIQINHMVVLKDSVGAAQAGEITRLLRESRRAAGDPPMNPFGRAENERNLEVAIDCLYRQKMIEQRMRVEALYE